MNTCHVYCWSYGIVTSWQWALNGRASKASVSLLWQCSETVASNPCVILYSPWCHRVALDSCIWWFLFVSSSLGVRQNLWVARCSVLFCFLCPAGRNLIAPKGNTLICFSGFRASQGRNCVRTLFFVWLPHGGAFSVKGEYTIIWSVFSELRKGTGLFV